MKRAVIVGASGMVGGYALRSLLDDPAVGGVTSIGRRNLGVSHPKLTEILLHPRFRGLFRWRSPKWLITSRASTIERVATAISAG